MKTIQLSIRVNISDLLLRSEMDVDFDVELPERDPLPGEPVGPTLHITGMNFVSGTGDGELALNPDQLAAVLEFDSDTISAECLKCAESSILYRTEIQRFLDRGLDPDEPLLRR